MKQASVGAVMELGQDLRLRFGIKRDRQEQHDADEAALVHHAFRLVLVGDHSDPLTTGGVEDPRACGSPDAAATRSCSRFGLRRIAGRAQAPLNTNSRCSARSDRVGAEIVSVADHSQATVAR